QRQRWLDQLCNFQAIGSFAMTEPNHGSDIAGGMETTATKITDGWVINGHKSWIGAATFADFALVWARDTADQQIKGFIVQMDLPGISAEKIYIKIGLRVMQIAELSFDQVENSDADARPVAAMFEAAKAMLR